MRKTILPKIKETLFSCLPIAVIIVLVRFIFLPDMPWDLFVLFFVGLMLLMLGIFLFSLGTDNAMIPIGQMLGKNVGKSKNIWFIIIISFFIGAFIVIAEPNLHVYAEQIPKVNNNLFILVVGLGIGVFFVLGILRTLFKIKAKYIFSITYFIIISLVIINNQNSFVSIAFDSAGAATGPIAVPFIMTFGAGIAAIRSSKTTESDSFGLVGIAPLGSIFAVLVFGLFSKAGDSLIVVEDYVSVEMSQISLLFIKALPQYMVDVAIAISPVIILFLVFQLIHRDISFRYAKKLIIGLIYLYIGITLFLTGTNIGFVPLGQYFGKHLTSLSYSWILIPIGFLIGVLIIIAEPAVHVLKKQVEQITGGAIPNSMIFFSLTIGVGSAVALTMVRALYHINILYFLVPGYIIANVLSFFVPEVFTAIAFDSGSVATGVMASTFIVPLAMGSYLFDGPGSLVNSFGAVALVAMMPIIAIQIMGLIYKIKSSKKKHEKVKKADTTIVELQD